MTDFADSLAPPARGVVAPRLHWPARLRAAWRWPARRRAALPRGNGTSPAWLLAPASLAALIGVPLVVVAVHAGALAAPEVRHLAQTVLPRYVANTAALVVIVAALSAAVGVTAAWLTTAFEFPGRRALSWLLILPLALPTYVAALAYAGVFDYTGPAQLLFRKGFGLPAGSYPTVDVQTFAGLCFVLTVTVYPYVYLAARAVFARQSGAVLEIARSHGYSGLQAFRRAALPLARPGIAAGMVLAAMETLGEYGASHYFGVDTLTIGIFRAWFALGSVQAALSLASVLLLAVAVIMALEHWQRRRSRYHAPGTPRPLPRVRLHGGRAAAACAACALPVLLGFAAPVAQLVWWALRAWTRVDGWQLAGYLGVSLGLAAAAALFILVLAVLIAYTTRLRAGRTVGALARCATAGYAVPGAVLAVGIATAYTWLDHRVIGASRLLFGVSPGLIVTGTVLALLAGYVVRFFAVGYHNVDSGFAGVARRFDEVARSGGLRPRQALVRVGIPSLRPALTAAAVLLTVDVLKELPLTMILRPFNLETLATRVFRLAGNEMLAEAALPALLIVAVGAAPVILLQRLAAARQDFGAGAAAPDSVAA